MSFGEWVSRQLLSAQIRKHSAKRRHRKASRLSVEELEARRMLAQGGLVVVPNPNVQGGMLIEPDPNVQWLDKATPSPDLDYYSLTLTFSRNTDTVQYSWTRLTTNDDTTHPAPMGNPPFYPTNGGGTIDAMPGTLSIAFEGNDPGKSGHTNELHIIDSSGVSDRATIGRDETFLMTEWTDSTLTGTKLIGPRIDYDPFPNLSDETTTPENITLVWYNSANPAFAGTLGGNSSGKTQPLTIWDKSGPTLGANPTGGDRFAIGATDPFTNTTLEGGNPFPIFPGHFIPPTETNFVGDEYDITSDAVGNPPNDNDGPNFNGDLNSILGPLTILQRAGQGTIILNDKANTIIATPKNVISSSPQIRPIQPDLR